MSSVSILQAAHGQKATKEHFLLADGTLDKTSYQQAKWFNLSTEEVTSFDDLVSLLERFESDHQKDKFVIRGVSADGVIATQKVRRKTFDPLSQASPNEHPFREAEHNWLMIDLDHIPLPAGMPIIDAPEAIVEYLVSLLPEEFQQASVYWQFSSSAGLTLAQTPPTEPTEIAAHLWFWLATPTESSTLKRFANSVNNERGMKLIDPALFGTVQPHYVAAPEFRPPLEDPLPVRSGVIRKASDSVVIDFTSYITINPASSINSSAAPLLSTYETTGYENILEELGDHDGGAGFNEPLTRASMSYLRTFRVCYGDSRIEVLKADLRNCIDEADQSKHTAKDIERYKSDQWLDAQINSAIVKLGLDKIAKQQTDAGETYDSEQAGEVLRQAIQEFTEAVFHYNQAVHHGEEGLAPPTLALKAAAGIGKTTAMIRQCINSGAFSGSIDYYVPSHVLASDVARALKRELDIDAEHLGIQNFTTVRTIRGRDQLDDNDAPMCTQLAKVHRAIACGLSAQKMVCENDESPCQDVDTCPYQNQFKPINLPDLESEDVDLDDVETIPPIVNVMPHNYLFIPTPMYPKNPGHHRFNQTTRNLAVVDEKFWDKGIKSYQVPLATLSRLGTPIAALITEALEHDIPLLKHLSANGISEFDLRAEAERIRPKEIGSDAHRDAGNKNLYGMHKVLADEVEQSLGEHSQCISVDSTTLQVRQRWDMVIPPDVPMVFIDADLSMPILEMFRDNIELKTIAVERQAEVFQNHDLSFYKGSLIDGNTKSDLLQQAEQFIHDIAETGQTLVVTSKKIRTLLTGEDYSQRLESSTDFGEATIAHFSNLRGLNDFENYENVIILGRQQGDVASIEQQAKSLWWDHPDPISCIPPNEDGIIKMPRSNRVIHKKDGSVVTVPTQTHIDPRAQIVNEQSRETESTQAIDRLRLVRQRDDGRQAKVFILSNVPLDMAVDHLFSWEHYQEVRSLQDECGSFIPLNPEHMQQLADSVNSDRTAKRRRQIIFANLEVFQKLGLLKGYDLIEYRPTGAGTKFSKGLLLPTPNQTPEEAISAALNTPIETKHT